MLWFPYINLLVFVYLKNFRVKCRGGFWIKKKNLDCTTVKGEYIKRSLHALKNVNHFSLDEFTFCGNGRIQRFAH